MPSDRRCHPFRDELLRSPVGGRLVLRSFLVVCCGVWCSASSIAGEVDPGEPCGAGCFESARAAQAACRDEGGSFFECIVAFGEALAACREEAGCEGPGFPGIPEPCGLECFQTARASAAACREDGGSFWDCLRAYLDAVVACREEAGCDIRERPEPCGVECFASAREAFHGCRDEEGSLRECAEVFLAELGSCREAAGCGQVDDEEGEAAVAALVAAAAEFIRGDSDRDGQINLTDPVRTLRSLFGGAGPLPCADAADADDSGKVEMTDAIYTLSALFRGASEPPAPFPEAGVDPTEDSLLCLD